MGGEPDLQVGIDAVGQAEPGPTMQATSFLGGDDVAGDLSFSFITREQQIVRGCFFQAGKGDGEASDALQQSSADQMKHRDQGVLAAETEPDALDQAIAA